MRAQRPEAPSEAAEGATAPVPAESLEDLLGRSARGDTAAFEGVYRELSGTVLGMVLHVLRDPAQSEEVVQEVFVEVWRRAARFDRRRGSAAAWVCTVAHRRAIDRVRSEEAATRRAHSVARDNARSGGTDDVPAQVESRLERERVRRCLGRLTETQRESVRLTYYTGYTYREAAELLNVPLSTVKGRLRDGLIRLRDCLGVPR